MSYPEHMQTLGFSPEDYDNRFNGLDFLYAECMELYIQSNQIENLRSFFAAGDFKRAAEAAHALKGSSGNLALMEMNQLYSQITIVLLGENPMDAAPLISRVSALERELRKAAVLDGYIS